MEAYLELQQVLSRDESRRLEATIQALDASLSTFLDGASGEAQGAEAARERATQARETVEHMRGNSIDAVRARFSDLSKHITGLLALVGPTNIDLQLYAFYCPMAGSGWLQREETPKNPYYGFSMHACGDSVGLLKEQ
ncbi:MAG: DUF3347 domain-containing protein [Lysobacterales bacterium]|nr:MAG: DUF3347 domain-containing protein [Xanthomonadales bacterium]